MQDLFWGAVLLIFNISVSAGSSVIHIFPSFAGYMLLCRGLTALHGKSLFFERIKPFCTVMTVYELIAWTIDICALRNDIAAVIVQTASVIAVAWVLYNVTSGMLDIQKNSSVELKAAALYKQWKYFAYLCPLLYFLSMVVARISIPLIILYNAVGACFVWAFYRTKNKYYDNL